MLTKEQFLQFALASIAAAGVQDPAEVEKQLDQLMTLVPHLAADRKAILDATLANIVTSVGRAETLVDDSEDVTWLTPESSKGWVHWQWLDAYLKAEIRRPAQVMKELDKSTNEVIDLLGNPLRDGIWDRRGLVVGHVQSGKTQHYTALTAKALDAGFKLVIILSGIHENLRQQTQERVEELIIGKDSRASFAHSGLRSWANNRLQYRISGDPVEPLPEIHTLTSVAGDYGAAVNAVFHVTPGQTPVILVVKKNVSILKNLLKWGASIANGGAVSVPTLVIDDEADHSSINTAKLDPETNPTTINTLIRKLLWRCDRVAFVGYTATPYGNIFMDHRSVEKRSGRVLEDLGNDRLPTIGFQDDVGADLFPKSFISNLEAPTNYIGPETVFGHPGDENLGIPRRASLPMQVEVEDADAWLPPKHNKTFTVSPDLPDSLCEALRSFLLSVAARLVLGHEEEHMSMLIHVSRFNDVQEQVTKHVGNELAGLIERLRHGHDPEADWTELEELWTRVFVSRFEAFTTHPSQQLVKPVLPAWDAVRAQLFEAFNRITFQNINSTTKENLDYKGNDEGLIVAAVGGDRLSRGLTLEGLSISYFLRGAKAFDTLMQMGRWFGYRPGYAHLCRVYAPLSIIQNFRTIALATEELRREFSRMFFLGKRPTEYGLRVREPRADLLVTAMNKMRRGETMRVHFAESLVSSLDIPTDANAKNLEAFRNFVTLLESAYGKPKASNKMASNEDGSYHSRWEGVAADAVVSFLAAYRASINVCFEEMKGGATGIANFVQAMNAKGELTSWTVALIGNSRLDDLALSGKPYKATYRNIDKEKAKTRKNRFVFQGMAMGQDEAIDLTAEQLALANGRHHASEGKASKADCYRLERPKERGLLLLYPVIPRVDKTDGEGKEPMTGKPTVVGLAVSFPSSDSDTGQDYVCNPRMIEELFGSQLAEDIERDKQEEDADKNTGSPK
jgi:hypothetical protein